MSEFVQVTDADGVRTVRMNRPEKKNALTSEMYAAMAEAIDGAANSPGVHCILMAGAPGVFSAGNDMQDFMKAAAGGSLGNDVLHFLHALARSEKPLVAAVQGLAVGVGTTMLFHCDYVVVADNVRLITPFVSLGILPEAGSSLLGPRLMGHQRAFALLAMGRPFDAAAAKEAGIANVIAPMAEVDTVALQAARDIAALPQEALAITRSLLRGSPADVAARIDHESGMFRERLRSPEAQAAFTAFLNRSR